MKVSVVIPTYNRVEGLIRALKSIQTQTIPPSEVIIVEDGSNTISTINYFSFLNEKGIKTIYKRLEKNVGACAARNYGVNIATGNIIMFLDDDDTWESKKVENQISIFKKNKDVDLVYTGKLVVKEADRNKIVKKIKPKSRGILYPELLYKNLIGSTSSIALKRDLFLKIGGFDESLPALQDIDLYLRYCQIGGLVEHDNAYNIKYTIATNPSKQISGSGQKQKQAVKILLNKYSNEIRKQGFLGSRRIKSTFFFAVAKSVRKNNYFKSIPYSITSLLSYPNLRSIALLIPFTVYK